jgi:hypothetical protein
MSNETPMCAQRYSEHTLAAWRDGMLNHQEAAVFHAHIATCMACQQTLARYAAIAQLVRQQPTPDVTAHIWRALQPHLTPHQKGALPMSFSPLARRALSALTTVALAVVVVVILAQSGIFNHRPMQHSTSAISVTAPSTPTAIPSAQTAWGAQSIAYLSQILPDGALFEPTDILPDGSAVVGFSTTANEAEIDLMATVSGQVTPLLQLPANVTPTSAFTDGTLVVWTGTTTTQTPVAGVITIQSRQAANLGTAIASLLPNYPPFPFGAAWPMDHGQVFVQPNNASDQSIMQIDVTTGRTTMIATQATLLGVRWPNLLYETDYQTNTPAQIFLYDIPQAHAQLESFIPGGQADHYTFVNATLSDDAVFWLDPTNTLHAADLATQRQTTVGTHFLPYSGNSYRTLQANARLIVWVYESPVTNTTRVLAWDRTQQRMIELAPNGYGTPILHGNGLVFFDSSRARNQIAVITTTQLPS